MNNQEIINTLLQRVSTPPSEEEEKSLQDEEIIDLGSDYNFDGFQVVRREFFAHLREPSASFSDCKFSVNTACLQKFPEANAVQVLINQETHLMALMPCDEEAKDSFLWCKEKKGKRQPKPITCRLFFAKVVDMMGWNPSYRYKLLGKLVQANGSKLLVFDLDATEMFQRTVSAEGKVRSSRKPIFPAEWQNQFGIPYSEHQQALKINIFDGYAVYSLQDAAAQKPAAALPSSDHSPEEQTATLLLYRKEASNVRYSTLHRYEKEPDPFS